MFESYLSELDERDRAALQPVIELVQQIAPEAGEGRSYGLPAFQYRDKPLLGFATTAKHLSLYPFSPQALDSVRESLAGYSLSKGTVRFTADTPLPEAALRQLVLARMAEIEGA